MSFANSSIEKTSFNTCDIAIAEKPVPEIPYAEALRIKFMYPPIAATDMVIEACSQPIPTLVSTHSSHGFVATLHMAFAQHRPLVISPDHIWLLICQGFAAHVNAHAEDLRRYFVDHSGKILLQVRRPDFKKGNPNNDWEGVVAEFNQQIRKHLGAHYDLIDATFSTTTSIERVAYGVTLMDAMQNYFDYMMTLCGIPSITLEGNTQDWLQILDHAQHLRAFECGKWISVITPLLEQFVQASQGNIDLEFWRSIYKVNSMSGGPYVTGWIVNFFPYIGTGDRQRANPYLGCQPQDAEKSKLILGDLPMGVSRAPFKFDSGKGIYDMNFMAGFVGIAQDIETKALRSEIGWAVCIPASRPAEKTTTTAKKADPSQRMSQPPKTGNWIQRLLGKKDDGTN